MAANSRQTFELSRLYNPVNPEMASTLDFYDRN